MFSKQRNNVLNQKSIARKCVSLINNQGATWENLEMLFGRDRSTLQRYLRVVHYSLPENSKTPDAELTSAQKHNKTVYLHLLQKAVENAKAEAEAKKAVEAVQPFDSQESTAIVVETGYLIYCARSESKEHSLKKLSGKEVFLPKFCFSELQNLSYRNSFADEAFYFVKQENFSTIQLTREQEEDLLVCTLSPSVKPRIRGIAAVCSELFFNGLKVHLFTTSKDVEHLVLSQGFGDKVEVSYIKCNKL